MHKSCRSKINFKKRKLGSARNHLIKTINTRTKFPKKINGPDLLLRTDRPSMKPSNAYRTQSEGHTPASDSHELLHHQIDGNYDLELSVLRADNPLFILRSIPRTGRLG